MTAVKVRRRLRRSLRRAAWDIFLALLSLSVVSASLPAGLLPAWLPSAAPQPADAETLTSPRFASAALMPNGQVGLLMSNVTGGSTGEIRFVRYTTEHAIASSVQLSTAYPWYPQLVTFGTTLVAAYIDNRSPNQGKFLVRTSTDNGASWSSETQLFSGETFNYDAFAPRVVASHAGTTLYVFTAVNGARPKYRSTTDSTLASWSSAVDAGDTSMRVAAANNCGSAGQECYRAHAFGFMETATAGSWVYISKSDSGFGQSGRGTQVGSLGGSWSTQVDHGGSGGLSGGGDSTATTFLDRSGNVYFIRAEGHGYGLYFDKSTDGGATWGADVQGHSANLALDTTAAPVGLFVSGYTFGEYLWYAGFGGTEDTLRVVPLWTAAATYSASGTVRLFGSAGGDVDPSSAYPFNFGDAVAEVGAGGFSTSATDLTLPGRRIPFAFTRAYSSGNAKASMLGQGWSYGFDWQVVENDPLVTVFRGDGSRVRYTRSGTTYTPEVGVFDVLTKTSGLFTLTTREQLAFAFNSQNKLASITEPAGNAITLTYASGRVTQITETVGRVVKLDYGLGGSNLALGKTYTKSAAASSSYPDTGGTELTDGAIGDDGSFSVAAWSGYQLSSPLDVTIDLGATTSLGGFRSYFFHAPASGIYRPSSVEILGSTDNSTYTSLGSTSSQAAPKDSRYRYMYDLVATGSARYVRFRISSGGTWTFASEMQVFAPDQMPLTTGADIVDSLGYTKSAAPSGSYPDSGNTELTDGTLGEPSTWNDSTWQGHSGLGTTPLDVTFDLGTSKSIGLVRSWHAKDEPSGIYLPSTIEIQTSPDNTTWTSRGSTTQSAAINDAGLRWRYEVDANGGSGRYVRVRITSGGSWLFSSEIQVFTNAAPPVDLTLAGDRIFALSDPSGRKTTYSYNTWGRLNRVTDRLGNTTGQDPTAHTWRYGYDGKSAHLTTVTDPDGRVVVTNTYSAAGRLATQKNGLGKTTSFAYSGSTLTVTDPRSHDSVSTFDSRSRPLTVADTISGTTYTTTFTYDDCGDRSSVTDRRGNRTDYTYDTACKGNLLTLQEAQLDPQTPRFTTTWTYDSKNNPTLRTDAKSFTTSWTYDATANVRLSETRQIDATTSATTKWIYGDTANPGLPTRVVAPRGNTTGTPDNTYSTVLAYDSSGNLTSSTDADGDQTTYAYDTLGRRTSMVDPDGNVTGGTPSQHTWSTAYAALDRVSSETDPLSHATSYSYDNAGHRTGLTDKNGNLTTYVYDAAGQLSNVQQKPDPSGQPTLVYTTSITRDDDGNATSVTQANSVVTDYAYDVINRLTSMTTHPATGTTLTTTYALDGNGNVTTRTTADSVATTYTFDNLDRLTQIAATGLSTISYAYDELSRRASMSDVTGTTTSTFDRMGRLTQAAQPNSTTSYAYDLDSNRTTLTYPGSSSVTYTFSNAGRLSSLSDWASRSTSYTYTAAGLAATVTLPNSMVTTYTYDRAQRLTNLTNVISGTTITSHAYTLDSAGNRTALSEFVSGITTGSSDSFGFTYDGLERLTAVTTTNAESFTLDGASNITARTGPTKTFTIDGSNRPTSDGTNTLTWSTADRLTGRGSDSFGFDPLDRLTSSTVSGTSRTYAYSGDGLLQSRTTGGATVSLLWDPATGPSRLLVSGSDKIVYGLGPLYSVNGSTVTTYARDGQKSIRAELNGTSVTSSWRYRAYGDVVQSSGASSTPSIIGYAGQLLDPSGPYYMRARWYDPASGRFLTRDPAPLQENAPARLNGLNYADTNPTLLSDPTGHCPFCTGLFDATRALVQSVTGRPASSASAKTPATNIRFLADFVAGTGATDRNYGANNTETTDMQESLGVQSMRGKFVETGCESRRDLSYSTVQAFWDTVANPLTADWWSTAAQVGGFADATIVNNDDGTITVTIPNEAGANSFFYHVVPNAPWTAGPFRTIHQTFTWTESAPAACQ